LLRGQTTNVWVGADWRSGVGGGRRGRRKRRRRRRRGGGGGEEEESSHHPLSRLVFSPSPPPIDARHTPVPVHTLTTILTIII
jgi:hypothetical protein